MDDDKRIKKAHVWLSISIVCAAAFMIVLIMSPFGQLRMTYDSYDLIAASHDLPTYLTGNNAEGHSYLVRAPLHPFLLSFFEQKMLAMWWINLVSLIGSWWMITWICRMQKFSLLFSVAVASTALIILPFITNFQFFWTEPLFIFLLLLLAFAMMRELPVMLIIALLLLLFLTRKAGIFFFAGVSGIYLIEGKGRSALIMILAALVVFTAWQWLEHSYDSTGRVLLMLDKRDSFSRLPYIEVLTSWFLPSKLPLSLRIVLVLGVSLFAWWRIRDKIFEFFADRQNVVLVCLAGIYTGMLIAFAGTDGYETAERLLSVTLPLWAVAAFTFTLTFVKANHSLFVRYVIFLSIALWFTYTILRTVHHLFWPVV